MSIDLNKYSFKQQAISSGFSSKKESYVDEFIRNTTKKPNQGQSDANIKEKGFDSSIKKKSFQTYQSTKLSGKAIQTYPITQRKYQQYDTGSQNFMNRLITPLKYQSNQRHPASTLNNEPVPGAYPQLSQTTKYREVLVKLDQAEQRLVISQKRYGQIWRKYEQSCESIRDMNKQMVRSEQKHLQQLFDYKVKFDLLQKQNSQNLETIKLKEIQIQTLRYTHSQTVSKLKTSETNIEQLQQQLQNIFIEKGELKKTYEQIQNETLNAKQQKYRSLERIIQNLKREIQSLHQELDSQSNEVHSLRQKLLNSSKSRQPGNLSQTHSLILSQLNNCKDQIGKLYNQKLALIKEYENKLQKQQCEYKFQIQQANLTLQRQMQKEYQKIVHIKLKNEQLQANQLIQSNKTKDMIQNLRKQNKELCSKAVFLQTLKNQYESQIHIFLDERKQSLNQSGFQSKRGLLQQQQQSNEYKEILHELKKIQKEYLGLKNQMKNIQKELVMEKIESNNRLQQIRRLEREHKQSGIQNSQLGKKYKESNKVLLQKMIHLENDKEEMERQLLAQRLESARLRQQLNEKELYLRKQYELSLQNVKSELSRKIRDVREEKNIQISQKQKIYVQLRELQKKYELLVSEMLTVDDMMNIATKVHKRHSKFIKK